MTRTAPSRCDVPLATICFLALTAISTEAGEFGRFFQAVATPLRAAHREPPASRHAATCEDSIERLAAEIDWLEHHLNAYGSIVAKKPDVWGQSRLMRHRYEYEAQLQRQLGEFAARSQAAIRRSDHAFLSMALALEEATDRRRLPDPATLATPVEFEKAIPFDVTEQPLSLEPTLHLDQLSRYLNHLHELRRINEGDDSADAPGYALNLVRLPVSIMPGGRTETGHGAEITVIAEPCLGDDLLPVTFRNLVINDLVDLIAPALTYCVNDPECLAWARTIIGADAAIEPQAAAPAHAVAESRQGVMAAMQSLSARLPAIAPAAAPAMRTRRARMPIPFSQLADVSGIRQIAILIRDTHVALATHPASRPCIEYADVRSYLAEELEAAADFLEQDRQRPLWDQLPGWNLADLVRSRRSDDLARVRCHVFTTIGPGDDAGHLITLMPRAIGDGICCDERLSAEPLCRTTTAVLAWGILVESVLLNERLIDDIRESGCGGICTTDGAGPFFGPDPAPEARAAFNDYVRCRWPIRVFALDPVSQDQNVEDVYARRRELQVAMAMAFASGRLSASALTRFSRQLETDMATIALNKTAVGFAHGADTFGWRFYPRVQTPPTRGTLATFAETLCGPSADADLARRKLEPGQRECTAIIVMPAAAAYRSAAPCLGGTGCSPVRPVAAVEPLPAPASGVTDGPAFTSTPCCATCDGGLCNDREMVDLHLATPYGVTSHLLIPVVRRQASSRCSLMFTPGFDVQLTFSVGRSATAKADVSRVDEYFTASRDAIVIETPSVFVPPAKADVQFLLRDAATGKTAATFSYGDLPYNAARQAYVIAGGPLRNLIGDTSRPATDKTLRGAVKPWLDNALAEGKLTTDGDVATATLTATLVAGQQEIPIGGSITVTATRRGTTAASEE